MKKILLLLLSLILLMQSCICGICVSAEESILPQPQNISVNACNEAAILSWENPVYTAEDVALSKIIIYDEDGNAVSDNFSTDSGIENSYKAENLINGTLYSYTIEFNYENGENVRIITELKPQETTDDGNESGTDLISALYTEPAGIMLAASDNSIENNDILNLSSEAIDYSEYEPQNIIINGGNENITISWRNPNETDGSIKTLRKIKLYKINEDKTESLLSGDFSLTEKAACVYIDSGLKNGETYSYRLSFLYENDRPLDLYLAAITDKATKKLGLGTNYWNVSAAIGVNEFTIDRTVYSGENSSASMKFTSNSTQNANVATVSDIPYKYMPFTAGKTYRVEFDCKGVNSRGGRFLVGDWGYEPTFPKNTFEWTHVSKDFTFTDDEKGFYFKPALTCDSLWIDNLEVYELDASGNKTGSNMAENFSAENIDTKSEPQDIEIEANTDSITVSWENTNSLDAMRIYVQNENGTFLRAITPVSAESTKIGGLGYGEYTVIAKSVVGGIESVSTKTATLQPVAKQYETSEYIITGSGAEIESITEAGEYTVRIDVKNNYSGENFIAQLIVAQFNEKGEIIAVSGSDARVVYETLPDDYQPEILETNFTVSESANRVMVYLWNGIDGMDELLESRNLK